MLTYFQVTTRTMVVRRGRFHLMSATGAWAQDLHNVEDAGENDSRLIAGSLLEKSSTISTYDMWNVTCCC